MSNLIEVFYDVAAIGRLQGNPDQDENNRVLQALRWDSPAPLDS
jgi:hypothetical protein